MIDTHCHLLPGLDDGPIDVTTAAALARELVAQGVERVVCTPHHSHAYATTVEAATAAADELRAVLGSDGVALALDVAAEIAPPAALTLADSELVARAVGGRYVVLEVLPTTTAATIGALVDRATEAGLWAILAHPERARAVRRSHAAVDDARSAGALVQVLAPSLAGSWGEEVARTAWRLVSTGRADLLGSDAHGLDRRRPRLRRTADEIAARVGRTVADALTRTTPAAVVDGARPPTG